jgi:hypothetical protein
VTPENGQPTTPAPDRRTALRFSGPDAEPSHATRRPLGHAARAAACGVVAVTLFAVGAHPATARPAVAGEPACELASAPPLALQYPGHAPLAAPILRGLAERLRPAATDAQTGRYAYAAVRMNAADSTLEGPCVQTVTAYADEDHWRADDGSGQVTATSWYHDQTHPPPPDIARYPTDGPPGVVDGPVPTDPTKLAAALDAAYPPIQTAAAPARPLHAAANLRQRRQTGTATRLEAVAQLNAWHYTNRAARRAVLLVLADVTNLAYRGAAEGYPGSIAVSVDTGDWQDVFVLDTRTGALLVREQVLLRNGHQLGVHTPYRNAHVLYANRGRTPTSVSPRGFTPGESHIAGKVRAVTVDSSGDERTPTSLDTSEPHSARVWNYWLGGKDNFAADRALGDQIKQFFPDIIDIARESRHFLTRAVRYLAGERGIRQFLDIGTGLPSADNTHEVAQRITPSARIVYVDNGRCKSGCAHPSDHRPGAKTGFTWNYR